jgi:hypothetical protein
MSIVAKDVLEIAKGEGVLLSLWAGRSELAAPQRTGHALAKHRDRIFGGYQIRASGEGQTQNRAYQLKNLPRPEAEIKHLNHPVVSTKTGSLRGVFWTLSRQNTPQTPQFPVF